VTVLIAHYRLTSKAVRSKAVSFGWHNDIIKNTRHKNPKWKASEKTCATISTRQRCH